MAHGRGIRRFWEEESREMGLQDLLLYPQHGGLSRLWPSFASLASPSRGCTEGKATVILVLFTGYEKNPTSKPGKSSASEEDHLPLQVLQSH